MRTSEIQYKDDDYEVVIVVRQASVMQGMHRTELVVAGEKQLYVDHPELVDVGNLSAENRVKLNILRMYYQHTFPACIAATTSIVCAEDTTLLILSQLTMTEFLELPEAMVDVWVTAVFTDNPHWMPTIVEPKATDPGEEKEPSDEKQSTDS